MEIMNSSVELYPRLNNAMFSQCLVRCQIILLKTLSDAPLTQIQPWLSTAPSNHLLPEHSSAFVGVGWGAIFLWDVYNLISRQASDAETPRSPNAKVANWVQCSTYISLGSNCREEPEIILPSNLSNACDAPTVVGTFCTSCVVRGQQKVIEWFVAPTASEAILISKHF